MDLKSAAGAAIQKSINACVSNSTGGLVGDFIETPESLPAVTPSMVAATGTFFNVGLGEIVSRNIAVTPNSDTGKNKRIRFHE